MVEIIEASLFREEGRGILDGFACKSQSAPEVSVVIPVLNEAQNILSADQIAMQIKVKLIENLDKIIRESVKPMENIDGIKIFQVDGLTGQNGNGHNGNGHAESNGDSSLADQVVNSALRYRSQAPLIDSLMQEIGFSGNKMENFVAGLHNLQDRLAKRELKSDKSS